MLTVLFDIIFVNLRHVAAPDDCNTDGPLDGSYLCIYTGEPPLQGVHINIPYSNGQLCSQVFELSTARHICTTYWHLCPVAEICASHHVEQRESYCRPQL